VHRRDFLSIALAVAGGVSLSDWPLGDPAEKTDKKDPVMIAGLYTEDDRAEAEFMTNSIGMKMKLIPAGSFLMGATPRKQRGL
jgi:hypothetical protein